MIAVDRQVFVAIPSSAAPASNHDSGHRILVTRNSRDFAPLAREWAEAGQSHAGVILIWTLRHDQFAAIVTGIERQLARCPKQADWRDLVVAI